jgi:hypothetical protein
MVKNKVNQLYCRDGELVFDVMSRSFPNMTIYAICLMPIDFAEKDLKEGRFKHFNPNAQEHRVSINNISVNGQDLKQWFADCVSWIEKNTEQPWSVTPNVKHMSHIVCDFSFADRCAAVAFALTFL